MVKRDELIAKMLELDTMLTEGGDREEQCDLILDTLAEMGLLISQDGGRSFEKR